jgi:hypothetical protein
VVPGRELELLEADPFRHALSLTRAANEPNGPLTRPARSREAAAVSHTQIFIWCIVLIVLEWNHFKWIWWTYWDCRSCGVKNKDCGCGSKWLMLL